MTGALEQHRVECPYCGAGFTALIDTSEGDADYIQDCEICCRPIVFRIAIDGDSSARVDVAHEDDPG